MNAALEIPTLLPPFVGPVFMPEDEGTGPVPNRKFISAEVRQQMIIDALERGSYRMQELAEMIAEEGKRPASLDTFLWYVGITEEEFNKYVAATVVMPTEETP